MCDVFCTLVTVIWGSTQFPAFPFLAVQMVQAVGGRPHVWLISCMDTMANLQLSAAKNNASSQALLAFLGLTFLYPTL